MREAMTQQGINQKELVTRTGISKQSISQYLSGKYTPKEKALDAISKALNIDVARLTGEIVDKTDNSKYLNIPVSVAAKMMGLGAQCIRIGLQHGNFPFGTAIETSPGNYRYYINPNKFQDYTGIKLEENK